MTGGVAWSRPLGSPHFIAWITTLGLLDHHTSFLGSTHFMAWITTLHGFFHQTSWLISTHFMSWITTLYGLDHHTSLLRSPHFVAWITTVYSCKGISIINNIFVAYCVHICYKGQILIMRFHQPQKLESHISVFSKKRNLPRSVLIFHE